MKTFKITSDEKQVIMANRTEAAKKKKPTKKVVKKSDNKLKKAILQKKIKSLEIKWNVLELNHKSTLRAIRTKIAKLRESIKAV
ncbi:MAG: hypothetical protein ABH873_01270 [Candidatus Firestonebacteria bacterium]